MHKEFAFRSKFNKKESFDLENIPKHFDSVTENSIKKAKTYCAKTIAAKYGPKYPPQALAAMLGTINGDFNHAYATLEGDYGTRKNNLTAAYVEGCAELKNDIGEFKILVNQHRALFEKYSKLEEKLTGYKPIKSLDFTENQLIEIEKRFKELGHAN